MSDFRWRGNATSGAKNDWANPRNWTDLGGVIQTTNWPGSSVGRTDSVYFDWSLEAGASPCQIQTTLPLAALGRFVVGKDYGQGLGQSSGGLQFSASAVTIDSSSEDRLYLFLLNTWTYSLFTNGKVTLSSDSYMMMSFASFLRGDYEITGTVDFAEVHFGYISNQLTDLTVKLGPDVQLSGVKYQTGGQVTCETGFINLVMTGGVWTQTAGFSQGLRMMHPEALFNWNAGGLDFFVEAGTIDATKTSSANRVYGPTCIVGTRGIVDLRVPAGTITGNMGAPIRIFYGGIIYWPDNLNVVQSAAV